MPKRGLSPIRRPRSTLITSSGGGITQAMWPSSERRTPADGWNEAWLPVLRERCKEVQGTMNSDSAVPETVRKQMNEYCRQLLAQ